MGNPCSDRSDRLVSFSAHKFYVFMVSVPKNSTHINVTSPVRLKTKWRFLSDYRFYVRSFLTRAALHAARSTKALY